MMAGNSRNPGDDSRDPGLVMVSFRIPRWLKDEISHVAERRLSDTSAMVREALLAWLKHQQEEAA